MDIPSFMKDISHTDRTLLGKTQFNWLQQAMTESNATWQLLGQQVLMGKMVFPVEVFANQDRSKISTIVAQLAAIKRRRIKGETLSDTENKRLDSVMAYNLDAWDGYPVEREKLLAMAKKLGKNLAVVAGDTHNGWCSKLTLANGETAGYEFATPGVSSPGMEKYLQLSPQQAKNMADDLSVLVDDLQYCNLHQKGLLTLNITNKEIDATWHYVDTIDQPEATIISTETISQAV